MGRIKTALIKRNTKEIVEKHNVTSDFEENKKILARVVYVKSKKLRNAMAGFAARLKKREG